MEQQTWSVYWLLSKICFWKTKYWNPSKSIKKTLKQNYQETGEIKLKETLIHQKCDFLDVCLSTVSASRSTGLIVWLAMPQAMSVKDRTLRKDRERDFEICV